MMKPFRLLNDSLKNFAIGLAPAMVMALVCVAIQVFIAHIVPTMAISVWHLFVPPEPAPDPFEFMNRLGEPDARNEVGSVIGPTVFLSFLFFFHALVALILTAWLLRGRARFDRLAVLRRAARGAGVLTCAAAVLFGVAVFLSDVLSATRHVSFPFWSAAMLTLWFGSTALLLPARLMGHESVASSGVLRTAFIVSLVLVPWFFLSELLGNPIRNCHGCGGMFDGGCVFYPMLAAYLLGLTVSSAAVSAAACMPVETEQTIAPAA